MCSRARATADRSATSPRPIRASWGPSPHLRATGVGRRYTTSRPRSWPRGSSPPTSSTRGTRGPRCGRRRQARPTPATTWRTSARSSRGYQGRGRCLHPRAAYRPAPVQPRPKQPSPTVAPPRAERETFGDLSTPLIPLPTLI